MKGGRLLAGITPVGVVSAELSGRIQGDLLPSEANLLGAGAVQKRKEEFAAGRSCARAALASLGIAPEPILRGPRGEPLWPKEMVGSITHCDGYCAAAIGKAKEYRSIGIDAELNEMLPQGVIELIALQQERQWIAQRRQGEIAWDRLLFSIKESVYKLWYPLEHCWLDFSAAQVEINPEAQSFDAILLKAPSSSIQSVSGKFVATNRFLVTCAWI